MAQDIASWAAVAAIADFEIISLLVTCHTTSSALNHNHNHNHNINHNHHNINCNHHNISCNNNNDRNCNRKHNND